MPEYRPENSVFGFKTGDKVYGVVTRPGNDRCAYIVHGTITETVDLFGAWHHVVRVERKYAFHPSHPENGRDLPFKTDSSECMCEFSLHRSPATSKECQS